MNKLEKLIAKLCPNGVEYKPLGEIATDFYRGNGILRNQVTEMGMPCVRYGEIYTTYGAWFDTCVSHTKIEYVGSPKYFEYGDILFAITGEKIDEIGKAAAYVGNDKCLAGGDIVVMKHKEDPKYLSYALSTVEAQKQKSRGKVKSKVVHLSVPELKTVIIPLPPLPVQQEIVRMLDDMAGLIGELEQELAARKQQYEWYERHLLTLEPTLPAKSLIELCDYVDYRGKTPKKTESGVFLVTAKNIRDGYIDYAASQEYIAQEDYSEVMRRGLPEPGDVLITTEAPCGNVAQVDRTDIALAQRVIKYRPKTKELDAAFLKYYMRGKVFQDELTRLATGGTVKGIKGSKLHQMKIVLPPLAEQKKIAARLDAFDKLCNSMTEGLPGEIALRKQQYEYYRDRLLDFRRAESGFQDGERRAG